MPSDICVQHSWLNLFSQIIWLLNLWQRSEVLTKGAHNEESWNVTLSSQDNLAWLSQDKEIASSAFQENVLVPNVAHNGEAWNNTLSSQDSLIWLSQHREIAPSAFQENVLVPNGSTSVQRTHKCCAYIANKSKYCARLNSIQAFSDINRDVRYAHAMLFFFSLLSFFGLFCSQLTSYLLLSH